ncbi:MAG TPA: hypothetical protein VEZ40_20540, partial [Pyrinomonadaceae bacterium]|nr:hypothetical protein [Pyrinomonadaceae bacterium]
MPEDEPSPAADDRRDGNATDAPGHDGRAPAHDADAPHLNGHILARLAQLERAFGEQAARLSSIERQLGHVEYRPPPQAFAPDESQASGAAHPEAEARDPRTRDGAHAHENREAAPDAPAATPFGRPPRAGTPPPEPEADAANATG